MEKWVAPNVSELDEMRRAEAAIERVRREGQRRLPRLMLHAHITAKSEDNLFTGLTENISEGGVFVSTLSAPGVGETIRLSLFIDDAEGFQVDGVVRWHRYEESGEVSGCGVQFENLTADALSRLRRVMMALPREPLFNEF
jgi:uncharacterized protein (TIGR02266 family)